MTIVLFFPLFFLDAQRQVDIPQNYLQILLQLADNHDFEVGNHSLRDPHSRQDRRRIVFAHRFFPPPENIYTPLSFMNVTTILEWEFGIIHHDEKLQNIILTPQIYIII